MRTAGAAPLRLTGRGAHGLLQLHRRLLQSHPAALRPGVSLAHLLQTGDANRPTVRPPPEPSTKTGQLPLHFSASHSPPPPLTPPPKRGNFNFPSPPAIRPRRRPSARSHQSPRAPARHPPALA